MESKRLTAKAIIDRLDGDANRSIAFACEYGFWRKFWPVFAIAPLGNAQGILFDEATGVVDAIQDIVASLKDVIDLGR